MKSLFVALLGVAVLAAPMTDTVAQPGGSPGGSDTRPSPETRSTGPAVATPPPSGSVSGSVTTDTRRDDGASALPRSSVSERTTIFGLSPTAAVLIAAALLLVVVLAIVAMTRSDNQRLYR